MEGEGTTAGVVEGAGAATKDCTYEEVPGLNRLRGEESEDGGGDEDVEEEGGEDDLSSVNAVADGAGEEAEGEHGAGAAEAGEGHLPGGAGELEDKPAEDEDFRHFGSGGADAGGPQEPEPGVSQDRREGGAGSHGRADGRLLRREMWGIKTTAHCMPKTRRYQGEDGGRFSVSEPSKREMIHVYAKSDGFVSPFGYMLNSLLVVGTAREGLF